jgi:hypothetical protein
VNSATQNTKRHLHSYNAGKCSSNNMVTFHTMYFHDENSNKGSINITKKGKTFTSNKFAITAQSQLL